MSRWLKLFEDAVIHPKIKRLPVAARWVWVKCLCVANKHDGLLPDMGELPAWLEMPPYRARPFIKALIAARLIDEDESGNLRMHNWEKWQRKIVRPLSENAQTPHQTVRFTSENSSGYDPPDRQKYKRGNQELATPDAGYRRKRRDAQARWETELGHRLGLEHYATAIDRLAADPTLVERITAAEMREPGTGVTTALSILRQLETGSDATH